LLAAISTGIFRDVNGRRVFLVAVAESRPHFGSFIGGSAGGLQHIKQPVRPRAE